MPPRLFVLAILLFWMATTGWLFHRDIWPWLRPGEPPPYHIDLIDEARGTTAERLWLVYRDDTLIGRLRTKVEYQDNTDTFDLHSEINKLDLGRIGPVLFEIKGESLAGKNQSSNNPPVGKPGISGKYSVNRSGVLKEIQGDVRMSFQGVGILREWRGGEVKVHVEGVVRNGSFIPRGYVEFDGTRQDLNLEPVPVSNQGSILNPLHPLNRVLGLRRGQHWQMPLIDPLSDSVTAVVRKNPVLGAFFKTDPRIRTLQAQVLPETQPLDWHQQPVSCLVIEYRGEELTARTWVRESDGLVLRQEASLGGEKLRLERE